MENNHIPRKTSRKGREEGVPAGEPKKNGGHQSKKAKTIRKSTKKVKRAKQIIEGQKFVTYLLKYRRNGGRRVSQQVHLKKGW